jgi:hypothetical protein
MTEQLRHEDFTPHVDKPFRFAGWHGTLRLEKVELLPGSAMPGAATTPFNLIFHGPPGDVLPEGLYRADVEDGPGFEFYIMPIRTVVADRQDYQAMFN